MFQLWFCLQEKFHREMGIWEIIVENWVLLFRLCLFWFVFLLISIVIIHFIIIIIGVNHRAKLKKKSISIKVKSISSFFRRKFLAILDFSFWITKPRTGIFQACRDGIAFFSDRKVKSWNNLVLMERNSPGENYLNFF